MADYIDREKLRGILVRWQEQLKKGNECAGCETSLMAGVIDTLDEQEAADVELVRHGGFIWKPVQVVERYGLDLPYCKDCGKDAYADQNYCRYCGAKMDE